MKDSGINIAVLESMRQQGQQQHHQPMSDNISSAQDGGTPNGDYYGVSDQSKGMSKMIGGNADSLINIKGIDTFLDSAKQGAAFSRDPFSDVGDGSFVMPVTGINAFSQLKEYNALGNTKFEDFTGVPTNTNLGTTVSAKENSTGASQSQAM